MALSLYSETAYEDVFAVVAQGLAWKEPQPAGPGQGGQINPQQDLLAAEVASQIGLSCCLRQLILSMGMLFGKLTIIYQVPQSVYHWVLYPAQYRVGRLVPYQAPSQVFL
jgi:hypothetical protein